MSLNVIIIIRLTRLKNKAHKVINILELDLRQSEGVIHNMQKNMTVFLLLFIFSVISK